MKERKVYELDLGFTNPSNINQKFSYDKKFVLWGDKNDYPDMLMKMLYNSPTHYNIIDKRVNMILGNEILTNKSSNKNEALTNDFLQNMNKWGENIEDILEKMCWDYLTFGMCALQVVWGQMDETQLDKYPPKIAEIYHLPMHKIRMGVRDSINNVDQIYYSENWAKYRQKEYEPIPVTPFTTVPEIIKVAPTQCYIIRPFSPGLDYYTYPSYVGGLNYINLDFQMSEFANSYVKNGFFGNFIFKFKNVPDDEKDFVVSEFERNYTRAENSNKIMPMFVEGEQDVVVENLTVNSLDAMVTAFSNLSRDKILEAHGISGILVGVAEAGSLGDGNEINNAYIQYEASKIKPDQNILLRHLNKLLKINGHDEISILSSSPIPFQTSEALMAKVLTVNETRELLGFEPIKEEDMVNIVDNSVKATPTAPTAPIAEPVKKTIPTNGTIK